MTCSDLDLVIKDIKQDFRRSLLLKREELITRLGNAFENIFSKPESICEEIKNSLKEEIIDKIISARLIDRHCPDKWKNDIDRKLERSKPIENCKTCDKPLKSHFYQYYHNDQTNEHHRTGLITSTDEAYRYDFLAEYKKRNGGLFKPYDGEFERLSFVKKERLCPECYKARETKIDAIHLHLVPDSFNAELAYYMSTLPDLSHYPPPLDFDEGYFGLGDDFGYMMQEKLNIAFAEESVTFDKYSRQHIDDLLNNFIKDKARRYPNDEELTRWLRQHHGDAVLKCKIFDMRGLDYIYSDVMRRFVLIIHLGNESGLWCNFFIPAKGL
jgi:hypothetical protein